MPAVPVRTVPLAGNILSSAPPGSLAASAVKATLPATILFVKCSVGNVMAAVVLVSDASFPLPVLRRECETTAEAGEWATSSSQTLVHVKTFSIIIILNKLYYKIQRQCGKDSTEVRITQ